MTDHPNEPLGASLRPFAPEEPPEGQPGPEERAPTVPRGSYGSWRPGPYGTRKGDRTIVQAMAREQRAAVAAIKENLLREAGCSPAPSPAPAAPYRVGDRVTCAGEGGEVFRVDAVDAAAAFLGHLNGDPLGWKTFSGLSLVCPGELPTAAGYTFGPRTPPAPGARCRICGEPLDEHDLPSEHAYPGACVEPLRAQRDGARAEAVRLRMVSLDIAVDRDANEKRADKLLSHVGRLEEQQEAARLEAERLLAELAAADWEIERLRAPQWTEATREAVRAESSQWWDQSNPDLPFATLAAWQQERLLRAGQAIVAAYLAALARGAAGEGER